MCEFKLIVIASLRGTIERMPTGYPRLGHAARGHNKRVCGKTIVQDRCRPRRLINGSRCLPVQWQPLNTFFMVIS